MNEYIADFKPVSGWRAVYINCTDDPTSEDWYYISDIVGVYINKREDTGEVYAEFVDSDQDGLIEPINPISDNLLGVYGPSADKSMWKALETAIENATNGS